MFRTHAEFLHFQPLPGMKVISEVAEPPLSFPLGVECRGEQGTGEGEVGGRKVLAEGLGRAEQGRVPFAELFASFPSKQFRQTLLLHLYQIWQQFACPLQNSTAK